MNETELTTGTYHRVEIYDENNELLDTRFFNEDPQTLDLDVMITNANGHHVIIQIVDIEDYFEHSKISLN